MAKSAIKTALTVKLLDFMTLFSHKLHTNMYVIRELNGFYAAYSLNNLQPS